MGGPTTQTTTATTAPSNPDVNPTLSKLLQGVQSAYDANPMGSFYDKPLYAGMGATTNRALDEMLDGQRVAETAFSNTFADMQHTAEGRKFGEAAPGYADLRRGIIDDVTTANLDAFNNSGMFGSDSNRESMSRGIGEALSGMDYNNYQNDIARQERAQAGLAGAYANTGLPVQRTLGVGQMRDADEQARLQAEYDRFSRGEGAQTDQLAKLSSILAGNAAVGGTNSSSTVPIQQPSPMQLLLGGGLGAASLFF